MYEKWWRDPFIWLVAGVALGLRLLLILLLEAPRIQYDAVIYNGVGANLAAGKGYLLDGAPFAGREPGYILVVALIYLVTGVRPGSVHIAQAFAGAVTCAITYVIGRRIGGRTSGLVAGLLLAASPPFLGYTPTASSPRPLPPFGPRWPCCYCST